jgi:hypothetical protein
MTKTLSMISHKNYNLSANEGFVTFPTSTTMTCYIDGFTSKTNSQSTVDFLDENEHVYWIFER